MLARNPKTGAPIRILRSEASLSRTRKTLVWLKDQDASIKWDRWETVCDGVDDVVRWETQGTRVGVFLLRESTQNDVEFFLSLDHTKYTLMFVTKALVFAIGWQKFRDLRITNVIVMEEAHRMYPFVGEEWNTTADDGILMIAAIIRMGKLVGFPVGYSSQRLSLYENQGFPITCVEETPMPLWYITQFYLPDKIKRQREIKKCLETNVRSSVIDTIILLNESDQSDEYTASSKVQQVIVGRRLSYKIVLEWIRANVPDNVICVFGNADIYLDTSWRDVWSVKLENTFLALLRWDVQEGEAPSKLFGPRNDSQDTWCVLSNSVKSRDWDWKALDIPFGKAGCDNAITVEMLRKKFLIVNPALSLKTHHLQLSNLRTYDPSDVVDRPCYMYVDPTGFHDMEPIYELGPNQVGSLDYEMFERRLRGTKPKALDVYCKMVERGERFYWKATGMNPHPAETIPLYKYTNAFQTPQGLVYGYNSIYVGTEDVSKEAWSKSQLSPIHPAYQADLCFAIPWLEEYSTSPESYLVKFLPKVLQLRERYGNGEFFAQEGVIEPYLECFQWNQSQLPVLSHKPTVQIWSKEIIQVPHTVRDEIHTEDVAALRKYLKAGWEQSATSSKWVVVIDGTQITTEMVRRWETEWSDTAFAVVYEGRTSPDRILDIMRGASGCIFAGGAKSIGRWAFTWALPRGASVIEIQNEMDPDGEAAHMSGAATLVHSLVIVPRATEQVTQEMILKEVSLTLNGLRSVGSPESKKPIVYIPRKSLKGLYGHAGDSFREMVSLWHQKGYVECVEHETAVQVWLHGVGKTLLYDRPTYDWLHTAPPNEQTWELALIGNPKPMDSGGPAKSWCFWPRNPTLLEHVVASGAPTNAWSSREKSVVFYGKVENKVQELRRKTYEWSTVCDEYSLVEGNAKYRYGAKEYLEALSKATFGLCLAGYGKKCHREVECMAMGCVPICAKDVDMEYYANPPQEGVHYIRVSTPEEVSAKIATISEQTWASMSAACIQWWKDNCSVEGSWRLTAELSRQKLK